jgi:hypothetical protein
MRDERASLEKEKQDLLAKEKKTEEKKPDEKKPDTTKKPDTKPDDKPKPPSDAVKRDSGEDTTASPTGGAQ